MEKYKGVIASQGLAIAEPVIYRRVDYLEKTPTTCRADDPSREKERLENAHRVLNEKLEKLKETALDEEKDLIDAEIMMLETMVMEAEELIENTSICAELAVKKIYEKYEVLFKESGSELINLRLYDLRDLASRLIAILLGAMEKEKELYRGKIVVADEIYPLDFTALIKHEIKGIVTRRGGITSHVAILARSYGVPYLIVPGLPDIAKAKLMILDAINGLVIIDPDQSTIEQYRVLEEKYAKLRQVYAREAHGKASTLDGVEVKVLCNIGSVEEARIADEYGCDGVGLLRTEFLYMDRETPPSDKEIEESIGHIMELIKGEVIVRAPDIGADKPVKFIRIDNEENPQLGVRGIRLLLKHKDILLEPFIRAVLRLSHKYGDRLKVMIPMVSLPEELREFYDELIRVKKTLEEKGEKVSIPVLGIMVETPASAKALDLFKKIAPIYFASIGSNDLTQYVLAVDRGNQDLNYLYDELQPPVIRTIKEVVEKATGTGVEISICGEMANKIHAIPILIGLGIRKLSVPISLVGRTKYVIRRLNSSELFRLAENIVEETITKNQVYEYVNKLLEKHRIEYV